MQWILTCIFCLPLRALLNKQASSLCTCSHYWLQHTAKSNTTARKTKNRHAYNLSLLACLFLNYFLFRLPSNLVRCLCQLMTPPESELSTSGFKKKRFWQTFEHMQKTLSSIHENSQWYAILKLNRAQDYHITLGSKYIRKVCQTRVCVCVFWKISICSTVMSLAQIASTNSIFTSQSNSVWVCTSKYNPFKPKWSNRN